ncbi:glycoside hydrolase superfamily [Xylaria sp. FL1777]|nr:glycoside hydrolase superfamily [Xylaria sp. FL1777]
MYCLRPLAWANAFAFAALAYGFRNVMYIDEWHSDIPTNHTVTTGITHVIMAFVDPMNFSTTDYLPSPPLMSVKDVRSRFDNGTKVGIALGGWGPFSASFSVVSTDEHRAAFSANLADWMVKQDYDFVDIDWEYPGGNGAQAPLNAQADIDNFPLLLSAVKGKLKPEAGISLALAGTPVGMEAFKSAQQAKPIWDNIDFITVMAYDFVNRASNMTGHHTDVESTRLAVQRYIDLGLPAEKINLGFAFYAKYFEVDNACNNFTVPNGCSILPAQDANGTDIFTSGVLTYEAKNIQRQPIPASLQDSPDATCDAIASFKKARENFNYDQQNGGLWFFDETTSPKLFWTWENTDLMSRKFDEIVNNPKNMLGGISGWSLGENTAGWGHVQQMQNMTRLRNSADQGQECPGF